MWSSRISKSKENQTKMKVQKTMKLVLEMRNDREYLSLKLWFGQYQILSLMRYTINDVKKFLQF